MYNARSADSLVKLSGVRTTPKWSFRGKQNSDLRNETPGPGQYTVPETEQVKFATSSRYGFGTSPRDLIRPASAPGPGEYNPAHPRLAAGQQFGFGTSVRQSVKHTSQSTPGPGSYTQSGRMGAEGPKYTATSKRAGYKAADVPGPGTYHSAPPPVADLNASAQLPSAKRAPKWGFGTSPREAVISNQVPGPGSYDSRGDMAQRGPKYSIRSKTEPRRNNDTPGPGSYTGALTQFGY
eukprot:TRINITY_DN7160_c0_g1_i2.p1 TRINITY_DN7160_c0_g1~~TRINITY_DN7160_c0_g1_i2.p1  ORF type:complete len:237 (-),score=28.23 TRINITY_DN7160_c0_g1_i2:90-800(-)